jgi:putative addiction module component (TIGR02574 family)
VETAAKLLEEAMRLPADEREELAATLLDSLEPASGLSIDDKEALEARAVEARSGAPGVSWEQLKRDLLK